MAYKLAGVYGLLLVFFGGCTTPPTDEPVVWLPPNALADTVPYPARNPFTTAGIALGKQLFFDPLLSKDNMVSCATCHLPAKAFADGHGLGRGGVTGKKLDRHTPVLFNLAWHQGFFWDGGAKDLESQAFGPLTHPDEMGQDLNELVAELQSHATYPAMFKKAFGTTEIKSALVVRALAQFQRTLISADSKYDRYLAGRERFSDVELKGRALFENHCATCHPPPFFTDFAYHNNGLDSHFPPDKEGVYQGRYRITLDSAQMGAFKTPSLRNVAASGPYMHDGRFVTLQAVLQHYSHGLQASATLAPALKTQVPGLALSAQEQQQLISFLYTLTDTTFLQWGK